MNFSNRSSTYSIEPNSAGYKTFSSLNIASAANTFKGSLPTLQPKHKKTKSDLTGAIPFDKVIPPTADAFLRSTTGSLSHRAGKSPKKPITDLNLKKLEEPFPNNTVRASITMRGTTNSRFQQSELYYDYSHPVTASHTAIGTPRIKERDDQGYIKQEEYIKKNPHFQKFNDCLHTIDRAETIKFSFSKEFFWSPAQVEFNEKMLKAIVKRKSRIQQQVQLLKENVKETVQLLQGKTCYYKVRCEDKVFPLQVKITEKIGAFEALVSKTENILSRREYDYIFTTNEFRVNYDYTDNIKFLYFAITAIERLRMNITINFSLSEETTKKKLPLRATVRADPKERLSHKKNTYEFFREGMRNDEFLELKDLAEEIRKEKRIRSLSLANYKDLVQENIQSAREYQQTKVIQLSNLFEKREKLQKQNRENKVHVKIEKDKQSLLNAFKFKIKRIEQDWNENEERKHQEKMFYQTNWMVALSLVSMIHDIIEKKKARVIVRIFERQRESKVIKIQRLIRRFLNRPPNYGAEITMTSSMARTAVKMMEALNALALTAYKSKVRKAQDLAVLTLEMACVPIGIINAMEKYNNTIVMIQRRWRGQMEMFNARVQVFLALWHQYCLSLITKEAKKKKKKYTEIIPLMKETRVTYYAKQYIQERITMFLREMRDYKNKNSSDENSDDTQSAQLDKTFRDTEHGDSFIATRRNSIQKTRDQDLPITKKGSFNPNKSGDKNKTANKGPHQLKLFKQLMRAPAKPKLKAKPSEDDLREVFDKICQELKLIGEVQS